ncbi:TetR family transcriptional regulator [Phenylobacterium sp.]|uniref:TetR family transcriptional regulator n=1 Tax=Phenylobacterium sp. TaxID=1871053 RepID=UPI002EDAA871
MKIRVDDRSGREQLLDAAAAVMTEAESVHVPLSAIARRAGVTAPLVTYHFGTKEGLLLALARRDTARALEQLQQLLAMELAPDEMLRIHISGIIRNYARRPYLNQLLNLLLRDEDSAAAREIKAAFVEPLAAAQRAIIERGVAEGCFRPVDPALAYFVIVGACRDFFTNKITLKTVLGDLPDEGAAQRYARTVTEILFGGLVPR